MENPTFHPRTIPGKSQVNLLILKADPRYPGRFEPLVRIESYIELKLPGIAGIGGIAQFQFGPSSPVVSPVASSRAVMKLRSPPFSDDRGNW